MPAGLAEVRGVVEDGVAAADGSAVIGAGGAPGKGDAGLEVGVVGMDAGVAIGGDGAGVGAGLGAGDEEGAGGDVEVGEAAGGFRERGGDAVGEAEVEREAGIDGPVVLRVAAELFPAAADDAAVDLVLTVAAVGVAEQQAGYGRSIRSGDAAGGVSDRGREGGGGRVGGEVLGEGHLAVEVGLAKAVVAHGPVVEAEDQVVAALDDRERIEEVEDAGAALVGRVEAIADRVEAGDGDEGHAGGGEIAEVGAGDAEGRGLVGAVADAADGVVVAVVAGAELIDDVRREDVGLGEGEVADAGAEVGGGGEGALGAEAGEAGGIELLSVVPGEAGEGVIVGGDLVIEADVELVIVEGAGGAGGVVEAGGEAGGAGGRRAGVEVEDGLADGADLRLGDDVGPGDGVIEAGAGGGRR